MNSQNRLMSEITVGNIEKNRSDQTLPSYNFSTPLKASISQQFILSIPPTDEDPSHGFVNQYGFVSIVAAGPFGRIVLSVSAVWFMIFRCFFFARKRSRSCRWFRREQKIAIHVTPPPVPLKSILIRHCSNYPSSSCLEVEPCRISITSTQLSNAINNLPKAYDSFTVDGYEDTIKSATRIGPSPSELLGGLVGADDANFSHNTFSTANESVCFRSSPRPAQMRHSESAGIFSRPQMESLLPLPVLLTLPMFPPRIVVRSPNIYKQNRGCVIRGNPSLQLELSPPRSYEMVHVHKGSEDHATFPGGRVLF